MMNDPRSKFFKLQLAQFIANVLHVLDHILSAHVIDTILEKTLIDEHFLELVHETGVVVHDEL